MFDPDRAQPVTDVVTAVHDLSWVLAQVHFEDAEFEEVTGFGKEDFARMGRMLRERIVEAGFILSE